jgi:hypothetical protein
MYNTHTYSIYYICIYVYMCVCLSLSLHTSACVVVRFYEMYEKEIYKHIYTHTL